MKVYIINLDKDKDRLENMIRQLESYGIKNYTRIPAIYGKEIVNLKKFGKSLRPSEIGCYLSHIKTMQKIMEDGVEKALILEDDVVLTEWFPKINEIINTLPKNFDMCWVGNCRSKWPRNTCSIIPDPPYEYDKLEKINDFVYKVDEKSYDNFPMGAYGLVVSKKGVKNALIEAINNNYMNPIDVIYVKSKMEKYMTVPSIITHCFEFGSNLSQNIEVYTNPFDNFWKRNPVQELACLDMLDILTKSNIDYSLAYGTLLGYARQQKFIPYDDDVDIFVKRSDLKSLLSLKDYMNIYVYPVPILNNTLHYKLYPKDESITSEIKGYSYRYPFIDVFVYDKICSSNIIYGEKCNTCLLIENIEMNMNDKTELVDIGSNGVKGLTIKTRVFKDMNIFLDEMYPNWKNICISSGWNHRTEKKIDKISSFHCKNILY